MKIAVISDIHGNYEALDAVLLDIDQQNVNVKLVGFADYPTLGPSHSELNARKMMKLFKNIKSFFVLLY